MNPLAALKEKLMVKPNVEERERVAVVIKGVKKPRKLKAPKTKTVDKEIEKGEEEEKTGKPKMLIEESDSEEEQQAAKTGPLIVDETQKGFDRITLLKKLE